MVITPGERSDHGSLEWTIKTVDAANTVASLLQAVALTIDPASLRPIIDLTGASAPDAAHYPDTVVADLFIGTPNTYGSPPTKGRSYGRGQVGYGADGSVTTLSTTAGTWSDLVTVSNVAVKAGRRYLVLGDGGFSFVSGGSGFAVGDAWDFAVDVNEGAGAIVIAPVSPFKRIRSTDTVAQRWPWETLHGIYEPAADATCSFRYRGRKAIGAATVTTSLDYNGGASLPFVMIEDVGAAV
jgi:hypothetical protein